MRVCVCVCDVLGYFWCTDDDLPTYGFGSRRSFRTNATVRNPIHVFTVVLKHIV